MKPRADGMNYAPKGKPQPVVQPGEFVFAAAFLDHGHIYGQCNGLTEAGGTLKYVYDPEPARVAQFIKTYPQAQAVGRFEDLLDHPEIKLIACAAIPNQRGPIGLRVLEAGKDYFVDKTPFTTLAQLAQARQAVQQTGRKYMVYYSERLHVECAVFAGQLIQDGAIGRVLQVIGFGPHRLNAPSRPAWFFQKEQYGGILCDIGSHQFEQFLFYSGAKEARVVYAKIANHTQPAYPELEDFGEANLVADNGATNYVRVDWLTPEGLGTWGDGRTFILGSKGYIEMRKYIDVARDKEGDNLYLVNETEEKLYRLQGQVGFPFFGELILDCLNRTEKAMTQAHAFKAAELCLQAQAQAEASL
jgi:predicted dehydrogenase